MTAGHDHPLHPDRYPALAQFVGGYLHQDFGIEHQTALGALEAFLRDASADERDALARELERFSQSTSGRRWKDVRRAFEALGGAWRPESRGALHALVQRARRSAPARSETE